LGAEDGGEAAGDFTGAAEYEGAGHGLGGGLEEVSRSARGGRGDGWFNCLLGRLGE
jgi:hypothetical protein